MRTAIGRRRRRFWEQNGFLVLPGFFTHKEVEAAIGIHDRTWTERPDSVVVDNLVTGSALLPREQQHSAIPLLDRFDAPRS